MTTKYAMTQKWVVVAALVCAVLFAVTARAAAVDGAAPKAKSLAQVDVDARVPLPPIWRASKAGKVVLLVDTVAPVPADMAWKSSALGSMLAGVGAIVLPPEGKLKLGFFARLSLVSTALHTMHYPDGVTLANTLPAAAYHNVVLANQRFNGGDKGLLRDRPGFAALALKLAALKALHLDGDSPVSEYLRVLAHRNHAQILQPVYSAKVDRPKDFARQITGETPADVACLSSLAKLLVQHPDALRARAQMWADGVIPRVQALDVQALDICRASSVSEQDLAQHGVTNVQRHIRATWVADIVAASREHRLTVAVLPVGAFAAPSAYLAALRQQGFMVSAPTFIDHGPD